MTNIETRPVVGCDGSFGFLSGAPLFEAMGAAALMNLVANLVCLRLLTPYREATLLPMHGDLH